MLRRLVGKEKIIVGRIYSLTLSVSVGPPWVTARLLAAPALSQSTAATGDFSEA